MTLHIFNPEHDIALASGLSNFTAPHAGRQLRHDLGFLPAVWAADGDAVVVDDVALAERIWLRMAPRIERMLGSECFHDRNIQFLQWKQLVSCRETTSVAPWGWNSALRATLLRHGVAEPLLPLTEQIATMRELSHRRTAAHLLSKLRLQGTVGEAFECRTAGGVDELSRRYGRVVLKAPWSSSGRGLRFIDTQRLPQDGRCLPANVGRWQAGVITSQGSVMVEPYYNKVKDFGMEFVSDGCGHVRYLGLSLFHTSNGAYTGNVLATEAVKRDMLSRYVTVELLHAVQDRVCEETARLFNGRYRGPFGVDMMVCAAPGTHGGMAGDKCFLLHPCVELNLRRTMGHVALALTPTDDDIRCVMRMEYHEDNYHLKISKL